MAKPVATTQHRQANEVTPEVFIWRIAFSMKTWEFAKSEAGASVSITASVRAPHEASCAFIGSADVPPQVAYCRMMPGLRRVICSSGSPAWTAFAPAKRAQYHAPVAANKRSFAIGYIHICGRPAARAGSVKSGYVTT